MAAAVLLQSLPAVAADAVSIDSLLTSFRQMPGLEARFREEKTIALLAKPLVSEGSIFYSPPGLLVRRTVSPAPSTVLVDGSTLAFWDGHSTERIDLDTNPVVRLYVDSFVRLLAGDRAALEKSWRISLDRPGGRGWAITLVPTAAPIAAAIREMRIVGQGTVLESMSLMETSGDQTWTAFTEVDVARKFSDSEKKAIFVVPGK